METLELTAPTLEDARRQAAAEFGVEPSTINLVVLEEKKGLFGKAGSVKVRAEKPASAAPVAEEAPAAAPAAEAVEAPAKPKGRAKKPKAEPEAVVEAPAAAAEEEQAAEGESTEAPAAPEAGGVVATQADADRMVEIFNHIFSEGDLRASAEAVSLNGKYVNIELDGRDVSYLVGKRGEVLNALQYIGNVIATRQLGNGVRVVIDGNSFRAKRAEVLEKQARDIAEQVKLNGMEAVLDPLPAFERRLVHQVLGEYPGVITYSEGEEPDRRVVIAPAE